MPEPRPPRRDKREPTREVESNLAVELRAAIQELMSVIPEADKAIAQSATSLRTKLLERRLHESGGLATIYDAAVQEQVDQLGVSLKEFEEARILVTVPIDDYPQILQPKLQRVRELLIDSVDQKIKGHYDLRNFFPDPRLHRADLYAISYEYVAAHKRLDQRRDQGRDSLTGLINDQGFLAEAFEVELKLLSLLEENRAMAVFRVDLDGFKTINDVYGHEEGDRVLKEFAENLRGKFRRSFDITTILPDRDSASTEGRPGGDEFVLILNDIDMQAAVSISPADYEHYPSDLPERAGVGNHVLFMMAKRILDAARAVILKDGASLTASIGYARIHQQEAAQMLYGVEESGYERRGFEYYNHAADLAAQNSKEWGDGISQEWSPKLPEVPMTPERILKKSLKRFRRDHPRLPIDDEILDMLHQQADLLARKYLQPKR